MSERLQRLYPVFADQIAEAASKGVPESKIEGKIQDYIRDLQRQGYEPEQITKFLNPRAGTRPTLDTPGEALEFFKQAVKEPPSAKQFIRGFGQEFFLGYAPKTLTEEPEAMTPGEQLSRATGEVLGSFVPFVGALKATGAVVRGGKYLVREAAGLADIMSQAFGASVVRKPPSLLKQAVKQGAETAAKVTTAMAATAGLHATPEGGPGGLPAVAETLKDPYALAIGGLSGVAHGALLARGLQKAAERARAREAKPVEQLEKEIDRSIATRDAILAEAAKEQVPQTPESRWSNRKLIEQAQIDIRARGEVSAGIADEVARRARLSRSFEQLSRNAMLDAKATVEAERALAAKRETRTTEKRVADALIEKRATNVADFTLDELEAGISELSRRFERGEQRGVAHEQLQVLREVSKRALEEVTTRRAKASEGIPPEGERPVSVSPAGVSLSVDDVRVADWVRYLGSADLAGKRHHVVELWNQYPDKLYRRLGIARVADAQFKDIDLADRLHKGVPKDIAEDQPRGPRAMPMSEELVMRAEKLFKPGEEVVSARIQRAMRVSNETAARLANAIRAKRGELPEEVSTVGAEQAPPGERAPNVQRAIDGLQAQLDVLRAQGRGDSAAAKRIERVLDDLKVAGKPSAATLALLDIQRAIQKPGERPPIVGGIETSKLTPTHETPPRPPEGSPAPPATRSVLEGSVEAPSVPKDHQVLVYRGERLIKQYKPTTEAEAKAFAQTIEEALKHIGTDERVVVQRIVATETALTAPRARRETVGLGKERRTKEIPVGGAEEVARAQRLGLPDVVFAEPLGEPAGPVYSLRGVESLAASKGVAFQIDYAPNTGMEIRLIGPAGAVKTTSLESATRWLMSQPERVDPRVIEKALTKPEELTKQDKVELDRYATEKAEVEPRETEPPTLNPTDPSPPEVRPIAGASDAIGPMPPGDYLSMVAAQRGMTPKTAEKFMRTMAGLFLEFPDLEPAYKAAMAGTWLKAAFKNPWDYFAMGQYSQNPLVRIVTQDGVRNHALPKYFEMKRQVDFYNEWFADLTPEQDRRVWQILQKKVPRNLKTEHTRVAHAVVAAEKWALDMAKRLEAPEWWSYLKGLVDKQALYEDWRSMILSYTNFYELPAELRVRFGDYKSKFDMVRRVFEKQDKYENLPKEVKRTLNNDLIQWYTEAEYDALPEFMKRMIPQEMWQTFSFTGGFPLVESWKSTFTKIMPVLQDKIHTEPFAERWKPLIHSLPGNISGYGVKAYLWKWMQQVRGSAERGGVSRIVDEMIESVENRVGRQLADPEFLNRLASRTGLAIYQSTLGFALDTAVINMTQHINTFAETGRVTSGLYRYLLSSDGKAALAALPKDVGIMEEMSYHLLRGERVKGIGPEALRAWDEFATRYSMSTMRFSENVLRGTAFLAGLEEAAAMGLDAQTAVRLGLGRASQIVPKLELTKAQLHALDKVARTQFAYEAEFQSPYVQGPLLKLSTIFWSFPTKQVQFMANGIARSWHSYLTSRDIESRARMMRYTALLGAMITLPIAGKYAGINLEYVFGSGLFPRLATLPIQTAMGVYNLTLGRRPLTPEEWDRLWKNVMYMMGAPGSRYGEKLYESAENAARGYGLDVEGKRTFDTTPLGEAVRLLGFEVGEAYNQRQMYRTMIEQEGIRNSERDYAMLQARNSGYTDLSRVEKYNAKWGAIDTSYMITGADLARDARESAKPLVERRTSKGIRREVQEEYGYQP
jgi:hypothetical protein